jgi:hypothetical protein
MQEERDVRVAPGAGRGRGRRSLNVADRESRMMSPVLARGRARVTGALTLLAGVLVLAGGGGQAHATGATIWPHASTLHPDGVSYAQEMAVNHQSGSLLIAEAGLQEIVQVDESGAPVPFTHPALAGATALRGDNVPGGLRVDMTSDIVVDNTGTASQGNIYIATPDSFTGDWQYRLQGFKASGELLFDVVRPGRSNGLGVAPDGNIWVGLESGMEELTPAGAPTGSAFEIPSSLLGYDRPAESDFDAAGNMYILLRGQGRVVRRSPAGEYRVLVAGARGLAFDPHTGNVLTSSEREGVYAIDQYGPGGDLEESTGVGVLGSQGSLALGRDGRLLFVLWSDPMTSQPGVSVFGPGVRRPEADAASSVVTSSATLSGVVRPGGRPTTYQFEYGTTKSFGSVAPSAPVDAGSGTDPVRASASLSGLKPQTFYYYRLKATVDGAVVHGKVRSLRTQGPAAAVSGMADVGPSSASFSGSVDPFDLDGASFHFLVEAVGSPFSAVSAELPVPAGSGRRQVSAAVTGLPPGQRFTVRLLATAGGATEASAPVSFQTPRNGALAPVPGPSSNPSPYRCAAPALAVPKGAVRAGDVVTLRGSDLGVGGTVLVGGSRVQTSSWSSLSVSFAVPEVKAGKVPVSVSCGRSSNSVELSVKTTPSSVFRLGGGAVKGSSGAVAVALPGAGTVVATGKYVSKSTVKVKKAGSVSVQVRLTTAGRRTLARSRSGALKVTLRIRYTPTGGTGRTLTKSMTFKRGASR